MHPLPRRCCIVPVALTLLACSSSGSAPDDAAAAGTPDLHAPDLARDASPLPPTPDLAPAAERVPAPDLIPAPDLALASDLAGTADAVAPDVARAPDAPAARDLSPDRPAPDDVSLSDGAPDDAGCAGWTSLLRLSPAEAKTLIETVDPIVINVHYPYEGDIPGTDATIAFDDVDAIETYLGHDPCADLLLVCRSGSMSTSAGNELIRRGYRRVRELKGGFLAWAAAGYPLLKDGGI